LYHHFQFQYNPIFIHTYSSNLLVSSQPLAHCCLIRWAFIIDRSTAAATAGEAQEGIPVNGMDNSQRQNRHSRRRASSPQNQEAYMNPQQLQVQLQSSLSQNQNHNGNGNTARTAANEFKSRRPANANAVPSSQATNNGQRNSHYKPNRVIVVEPSPCTTPALPLNHQQQPSTGTTDRDSLTSSTVNADEMLADSTQKFLRLNSMLGHGRASAPPQLFFSQSGGMISNQIFQEKQTISQQAQTQTHSRGRAGGVSVGLKTATAPHGLPSDGRTPIPSFENSPGQFSVKQQQIPAAASSTPIPISGVEDLALKELSPYVWESSGNSRVKDMYPSRALAIFGLSALQLSEVKSTCEAFGSLLYFRSEFFYSKGLLLIAYHDLRSARHAAGELRSYLQQMIAGSSDVQLSAAACSHDIKVLYSVSLTSSFERDGSALVISSLASHITDQDVSDLLASTYGELRSVQSEASGCLIVEFYDIQDADQAVLEIESTKPWGAQASVSSKMRQDYERKRGKDFLAVIGRWRQTSKQNNLHSPQPPPAFQSQNPSENAPTSISAHLQNVGASSPAISQDSRLTPQSTASSSGSAMMIQPQPTAQLVVGPDGQYSYVMVQHQHQTYPAAVNPQYGTVTQQMQPAQQHVVSGPETYPAAVNPQYGAVTQQAQPAQQHVVSGPHGTYITNPYDGQGYWVQQPHQPMPNPSVPQYLPVSSNHSAISHQPIVDMHHGQTIPIFTPGTGRSHVIDSSVSSGNTNISKRSPSRTKDDNDNQHLALDIELVKNGGDTRTSLMVRNIPNKYTQSMLVSEFQDSGHGPGKIDFFYLPIDFRNKCNRGYAFINFVDYADILSFYDTYNGKQWKVFKSEKICRITYARIQGQESMMKRFQNSALMEKDQEYRPLVFDLTTHIVKK
jgi:hypothetical protein